MNNQHRISRQEVSPESVMQLVRIANAGANYRSSIVILRIAKFAAEGPCTDASRVHRSFASLRMTDIS